MRTHGWKRNLMMLMLITGMTGTMGCQSMHQGAAHPFATMFQSPSVVQQGNSWEAASWHEARAIMPDDSEKESEFCTASAEATEAAVEL